MYVVLAGQAADRQPGPYYGISYQAKQNNNMNTMSVNAAATTTRTVTRHSLLSSHHIALIVSVLISILFSSVLVTRKAAAINLKNLFSSGTGKFWSNKNVDERPNNNYDELISSLGEDGYRELVMIALGLDEEVDEKTAMMTSIYGKKGGLDESYPAQHARVKESDLFVGKQALYESSIQGCRDYYYANPKACDDMEEDRIKMNLVQPKLMVNYTALGFQKQRLPPHLMDRIKQFWEASQEEENEDGTEESMMKKETWNEGNTYTNHWHSPTYMVNIPTAASLHAEEDLRTEIYRTVEGMIHQWIGGGDDEGEREEFVATSLYGIRIYKNASILAPHVDRLPLVTSAIINVAQDVDEDWPLEVYGHDGKVYNISMNPGDVLLYESHSVIHGRPFPLKGRHYANIFVHFEPKGYTQRFYESFAGDSESYQPAKRQYRTMKKNKEKNISTNKKYELPLYIEKGGIEESLWKGGRRAGRVKVDVDNPTTTTLTVHQIAARGKLSALQSLVVKNPNIVHEKDVNGWQPIHEAARGGHTGVLKFLIDHGVDINARPHGVGGTPLYYAKKTHGSMHGSVIFLESHGAIEIEPGKKAGRMKVSLEDSNIELTAPRAAAIGALSILQSLVEKNPEVVHEKDQNGWQLIHEAARGGHTGVIKFLIDHGVDLNARPNGKGGTPLYYAKEKHGANHDSVILLQTHGAIEVKPEDK